MMSLGLSGAPTTTILPSRLSRSRYSADIVLRGNGAEDEIETCRHGWPYRFRLSIRRCPSAPSFLASSRFDGGGGDDVGLRTEGGGEFHTHMAEAAEPDNADLLAFADLPVLEWRIGGDAGAEQGGDGVEGRLAGTLSTKSCVLTIWSEYPP